MKRTALLLIIALVGLSMLVSCRPAELEGAFVEYKANRFDKALELAQLSTEKYPQNGEAWLLLGRLYGKKDQFADMVSAFDKAVELNPQYATTVQNERTYYFQINFNKGVTNYNAFTKLEDRKSEKAQKTIDNAIEGFNNANIIKTDYTATNLLASCYNISDRSDESLKYYNELTKIAPDTAASWLAVGTFYFTKGNYEKSVENLKKALAIEPNNVEAVTLISQAYDMLKDTDNAITAYEKAKKLNDQEKAFPYNLGLIYNKLLNAEGVDEATKAKYLDKLIENFGQVIELDPDIQIAYQMKAYAEIQKEKYEDAVATLNTGIEHFPEEGALWFNLGIAYTRLAKAKEAKNAFKKAEELGYK